MTTWSVYAHRKMDNVHALTSAHQDWRIPEHHGTSVVFGTCLKHEPFKIISWQERTDQSGWFAGLVSTLASGLAFGGHPLHGFSSSLWTGLSQVKVCHSQLLFVFKEGILKIRFLFNCHLVENKILSSILSSHSLKVYMRERERETENKRPRQLQNERSSCTISSWLNRHHQKARSNKFRFLFLGLEKAERAEEVSNINVSHRLVSPSCQSFIPSGRPRKYTYLHIHTSFEHITSKKLSTECTTPLYAQDI